MNELALKLLNRGFKIDVFTNGTQLLVPFPWHIQNEVTIIMDWKLPGSGETNTFDINNLPRLEMKDALKFVVKDRNDFDYALAHIDWGNEHGVLNTQVWFSPVWGEMDPERLAEWVATEAPNCRLNIQTHKYIWDPEERRV